MGHGLEVLLENVAVIAMEGQAMLRVDFRESMDVVLAPVPCTALG